MTHGRFSARVAFVGVVAGLGVVGTAAPEAYGSDLLAASWSVNAVVRFDAVSGAYEGVFASGGGLNRPSGLAFGPDGDLYVSSFSTSSVLRYDGRTGAFRDVFVPSGAAGLNLPGTLIFRPDGFLYVLTTYDGGVLRFDAATGQFHDVFIPPGSAGVNSSTFMTFGPDGDLYLTSRYSHEVIRFSGQTGRFVNVAAGYVNQPQGVTFGHDGNLLVAEWRTGSPLPPDSIQRYTPQGAYLGDLTQGYIRPYDMRLGATDGRLYVSTSTGVSVFDSLSGELVGTMSAGGVSDLLALTWAPGTTCRVDLDGDGGATVQDFLAFLGAYSAADPRADMTGDGAITVHDFLAFLNAYAMGCP
jgi:DNA-binding beta-propeller fold protein YncE